MKNTKQSPNSETFKKGSKEISIEKGHKFEHQSIK
jgi:hypothetical protein